MLHLSQKLQAVSKMFSFLPCLTQLPAQRRAAESATSNNRQFTLSSISLLLSAPLPEAAVPTSESADGGGWGVKDQQLAHVPT